MRFPSVFFVCALFVSSCATQGKGNTTIGIDDSRFNKTMVGALAGAAGGATIGAVAADDAAAGIAIGAISGGIIGAGIGAVLAKNDAENDSLNEKSYQQQEKIKQQERDIDYLRSRDSDKKPPTKSSTADDGVGEENLLLLQPEDKSKPSPAKSVPESSPPAVEIPKATEPTARGSLSEKYPYNDARPSGSRQSRSVSNDDLAATGAVAGATAATAAVVTKSTKEEGDEAVDAKTKVAAKTAPAKVDPAKADTVKSEIAPTLKKVEPVAPTPTSVTPPPGQAGCKEAVKEAERGLKSSSDADRLFYLRRASRLCPSEPTYHVELGRMLSSLGKNNEAKQELKHALTLDPKNQTARDELSILENSSGRK